MRSPRYLLCLSGVLLASVLYAREFPEIPGEPTEGDKMLAAYFEAETARLEAASSAKGDVCLTGRKGTAAQVDVNC